MTNFALMSLMLFAKWPQPGKAKTRLVPALGEVNAARFAQACLNDLLLRLARENFGELNRRILCFDPPEAEAGFRALLSLKEHPYQLLAQSTGNLGQRLAAALVTQTSQGRGVVFIGADSPDLPAAEVRAGIAHAAAGRAYLQRATDGGYVLLALPRTSPICVFDRIAWSTSRTATEQIQRIREAGLCIVQSETPWQDVDLPEDLAGLRRRLDANPEMAPLTREFLQNFR
jgi:uncharacterized protein